ncbi:MAG: TAXI family TRAP transporter solute-binding subunit [Candidatus Binatia bacterium]
MKQPALHDQTRTTPATTRSQLILETVAEMVAPRRFWQRQVLVKLRHPGDERWTFTFAASDSAETIHEVVRREVDIAIINPSGVLTMAYLGKGPFSAPAPLRAITVIPSRDWLGFAVTEASGITSLADIKARHYPLRVSLRGQMDHTVHLYTDALFNAYGFSRDEILKWGGRISYDPYLPYRDERLNKVRNGEVDAIFDEAVRQFIPKAVGLGMRFCSLDEPVIEEMERLGFRRSVLTKESFPDLPADLPTLDYSGWTVYTHAEVPEDLVYTFCQSLDARKANIAWQEERPLPLDQMCRDTTDGPLDVPLHPGAERYWREAGYLS